MDINKVGRIISITTFLLGALISFLINQYKTPFFVNAGSISIVLFLFIHLIIIILLFKNRANLKNLLTIALLIISFIFSFSMIMPLVEDAVNNSEKIVVEFVNTTGKTVDTVLIYDDNQLLAKVKGVLNNKSFSQEFEPYANTRANLYYYIDGKRRSNLDLFDCNGFAVADSFENAETAYFRIGEDEHLCFMSYRGD